MDILLRWINCVNACYFSAAAAAACAVHYKNYEEFQIGDSTLEHFFLWTLNLKLEIYGMNWNLFKYSNRMALSI